ncbi:MAG: PASTA domain-containing protein [Clostridia bacterium]|nr:PASTA domain-containing protein [Clostridia bacterium]
MAQGVNQKFNKRVAMLLIIVLVLGFGAAIVRLGYLQLVQADELQKRAVDQQLSDTELSAKRGTIYDTNGKILAASASVWKVVLAPVYFENDEERHIVAKGLSQILDVKEETVFEKAQQESYYVEVKRQIESDVRDKVLEFMDQLADIHEIYNTVYLLDDYKRYYPYGSLASSVIGFTGADEQGLAGLEYQYDEVLTGTPGRLVTAVDSLGTAMPFEYSQNIPAGDGSNLVLTVDETIQSIAEKYMLQGIEDHAVFNRGVCIIMDVNTGAVRAMASVGGFDPNDPFTLSAEKEAEIQKLPEDKRADARYEALSNMWRNKAVSDTYYPGSVFKMCTAAMALEEGLVSESSTFYCSGSYTVAGVTLGCHVQDYGGSHGTQTLRESIKNSCNPALMQIGELLGIDLFNQYYDAFGFSEKTGIDLPGEADDIYFDRDTMGEVHLATASFGQNFAITPIQMATAVASIANGGYLVQPHMVERIEDPNGNVISTTSTEVKRQVLSKETAATICDILEENAVSGSGSNGYVAGYRVAGKTGTSEKKVDLNEDGVQDYIASFCGFAPAENAEVVCLVFFDTPTGAAYYGSQVAAPVFAKIMSEVLPYLEVATQYTQEELEALDTTADTYIGMTVDEAVTAAENSGFTTWVKGEGDTIVAQMPEAGTKIPQGGNVVLYTDAESISDTTTVPNLVGYNLSDVLYFASYYNLNVSISGMSSSSASLSYSQSIPEGTEVAPGTVITVTFSAGGVTD